MSFVALEVVIRYISQPAVACLAPPQDGQFVVSSLHHGQYLPALQAAVPLPNVWGTRAVAEPPALNPAVATVRPTRTMMALSCDVTENTTSYRTRVTLVPSPD